MLHLLLASLLWAFSFGLIKGQLAGIDPVLVAFIRLGLASTAFAPFLFRRRLPRSQLMAAMGLGALQFGLMYVLYIASYKYLPAWMVALFTVTTPLYVVLLAGFRDKRLPLRYLAAVGLAVAGAVVVVAKGLPTGAGWAGILLLQGANLCFAGGQVFYPDLKRHCGAPDGPLLAWMYLGSVVVTGLALGLRGGARGPLPQGEQWLVLLYLGLLPTALGFYLWNRGAGRVQPGFLAGINNLKVPLAVFVSWTVFGEAADYWRVLAGLALVVGALFMAGPVVSKKV